MHGLIEPSADPPAQEERTSDSQDDADQEDDKAEVARDKARNECIENRCKRPDRACTAACKSSDVACVDTCALSHVKCLVACRPKVPKRHRDSPSKEDHDHNSDGEPGVGLANQR
jgi:hypothetical protein